MAEFSKSLQDILEARFGLKQFREGQVDVLESVLNRKDTLAVMPTGRGKSLCYQIPAVYFKGLTVVISPLIALMKDQVGALKAKGITAGALYSGQTLKEKREVFSEITKAENALLYLSPERVQKDGFAQWIKERTVSLFAVDEAHCVSQWGPDFRPDYHKLSLLRELRPDVPILALTATATPMVLRDIVTRLQLRTPERHVHGFYRPNLYYQVEACENEAAKLPVVLQALSQTPEGRVLIYCGTRKQCEDVASELERIYVGVGFYHAGMDTISRTKVQKEFSDGTLRILAATNAFGMGIDHPDVRLVVHYQMPANIESYYQEVGRAGRDGKDSTCVLLYTRKDRALHIYFIKESKADDFTIKQRWRALDTMTQFVEGGECRHSGILTYFRDAQRIKACGHCDVCAPDSPRRIQQPPELLPAVTTRVKKRTKSKPKPLTKGQVPKDVELRMEVLREWRKEYADARDIPAFIVFSNKTLQDLAEKDPSTTDELLEVYGMGPQKVEHFGKAILEKLSSI
jgi:ATP-dependent DNA helicase RecQ